MSMPHSVAQVADEQRDRQLDAGLSPTEFKRAFRHHAAGVAVVTADAGDGPVGITASSLFSVSAEPPLMVFSISNRSSSAPTIRRVNTLVVHLLGRDQVEIARLCSTSGIDRFADTSIWRRLPTGEPHFPGVPVWIRARVVNRMAAGESTVIAMHALEAVYTDSGSTEPLVYHDRTWHGLGTGSRLQA
ncbi:flavin reductase family protein [Pseudolysinimonas sp.]|uniref:flavin reductase family protein n=1 Tax=Pseudolysinimonas sp. TaxID=2680009 RepID=UPI003F801FDD